MIAKGIAQTESMSGEEVQAAFCAGLLHDVGKLILAVNLPSQFKQALEDRANDGKSFWEAEQRIYETTHAEVGGCLLGLWGLPVELTQAVAFHHRPAAAPTGGFSLVTVVYVANCLEHAYREKATNALDTVLDPSYLDQLGIADRLPVWRRCCEGQEVTGP